MASLLFKTFMDKLRQNTGAAFQASVKKSRNWFRSQASNISAREVASAQWMASDKARKTPKKVITKGHYGRMMAFYYDPKWKKELPYYDRFPLIFPLQPAKNGFLGMNLHYLPYKERAMLMDALYNDKMINKVSEKERFVMTYKVLKAASVQNLYKPCIKHYLWKHVRSRFKIIEPAEWDFALFLPFEAFEKKSKTQVWRESLKIARGR